MAKFQGKQKAVAKVVTEKSLSALISRLFIILSPERSFYVLAVVYGIGISLLSLATPVSVQILINSVVNTGLTTPLVVISICLFVLLLLYGFLNALRIHLLDVFGRRFYARMVSEISLRTIYAVNPYFEDTGQTPLFNRYFDIIIVTKVVPYLLVGGFTVVSQAIVGFVLVSLYHPYFLAFNLFLIFLIVLIWMIWGRRAMHSGVELSHRKHATAAWLENLGDSNGFYNAKSHIVDALKQSEEFTSHYMQQHIAHFRNHFSQTIGFFLVYAFGSALLLGLGGWLVLQSQLNIGQLVAAELVLSIVFFGLSQLGVYLTYFYDLCGAIDELSLFLDVEQEDSENGQHRPENSHLTFNMVKGKGWNEEVLLHFDLPANSRTLVKVESRAAQQLLFNTLKGNADDFGGFFSIGGVDSRAMSKHDLRRDVVALDRPRIVNISIRDYLLLCAEDLKTENLLNAIEIVGLSDTIAQLDEGVDTMLAVSGWPLTVTEVMQLKLAAAILSRPRIVVLSELYDIISDSILNRAMDNLQEDGNTTILYLSQNQHDINFNYVLYLKQGKEDLVAVIRKDKESG